MIDKQALRVKSTKLLIDDDPTSVVLIPRVKTVSPSGSASYTDGVPRAVQRVKMSLLAFDQRPTITVAGVARQADFHMITMPDAVVEIYDYWIDDEGIRYDVISETKGWDYMRKFVVISTIPVNARP